MNQLQLNSDVIAFAVRYLMQHNQRFDIEKMIMSSLQEAIFQQDSHAVGLLLQTNIDVLQDDNSLIHQAISIGNVDIFKQLYHMIDKERLAIHLSFLENSFIENSCSYGATDIVAFLLERGVPHTRSSLILAIQAERIDIIKLFHQHHIDIIGNGDFFLEAIISSAYSIIDFYILHGQRLSQYNTLDLTQDSLISQTTLDYVKQREKQCEQYLDLDSKLDPALYNSSSIKL